MFKKYLKINKRKNTSVQENSFKHQQGQTLIIVLMVMIVALTVGVTVSSRYIKTLRNLSESDNSTRALAVAEAAVERMLIVPTETLEDYINFNNCGANCVLEIYGDSNYAARADVTLSFTGSLGDFYETKVNEGEVYQLFLNGYASGSSLDVCWDDMASIYASYIYENSGVVLSDVYAYNPIGYAGSENGFLEASPMHGYGNCFTVNTTGTPDVLRVKSYNEESYLYFVPASGQTIPNQGILITAVGRSGDAIRTVKVLKTQGSVPEDFDYVIFQKSADAPLSNRPN